MNVIVNVSYIDELSTVGYSFMEDCPELTSEQFNEVAMDLIKSNYSRKTAEEGKSAKVVISKAGFPRKQLAYAFMSFSERLAQED